MHLEYFVEDFILGKSANLTDRMYIWSKCSVCHEDYVHDMWTMTPRHEECRSGLKTDVAISENRKKPATTKACAMGLFSKSP
jgi:hypothetical protein